jgi:hypothetical protein
MIAKIATGEVEDATTEDGKNAAAVALGRLGARRVQHACRPGSARKSPVKPLQPVGNTSEIKRVIILVDLLVSTCEI